jgi:hypothetical protein
MEPNQVFFYFSMTRLSTICLKKARCERELYRYRGRDNVKCLYLSIYLYLYIYKWQQCGEKRTWSCW